MSSNSGLASVETKRESSLTHYRTLIEMFSATQPIIRSHKNWTANDI